MLYSAVAYICFRQVALQESRRIGSMQLTKKIRIFPAREQEEVLWHLSERCRLLYNFALAERKRAWELRGENVSYVEQQNNLPELKKKYPEYSWVYSKVLQMVLRMLDSDYKSFVSLRRNDRGDSRPPRFKGRRNFVAMTYNQSGFKIEQGKITLAHFYNNVVLSFKVPMRFKFNLVHQVSICKYRDGEFYLCVVYEIPEKAYRDNGLYQAIDLGIDKTVTAVNMYGRFFEVTNPRPDRYWNPIVDAIQSRRDHCKKWSRRWIRLHKALRRSKKKSSDQIRDYQHKLSRKMVDNTKANTFIIGKLGVKEMAHSKKATAGLNRSTQNNGYLFRFSRFLAYKAHLAGKRAIEISEAHTSKRCCIYGREHEMPPLEADYAV
jgi:putative transposase